MALAPQGIVKVVSVALSDYAVGDLESFLDHLSDNVVYSLHLDETLLPFAGEVQGKGVFRDRLLAMRSVFEYVRWDPGPIRLIDSERAATFVDFIYRHRKSGEILDGVYRLVWEVDADLKVSRIEEYHDAERIHAFARLMNARDTEGPG